MICEKVNRSFFESHTRVNLANNASKLLADVTYRRLSGACRQRRRENQNSSRCSRSRINLILSIRRVLIRKHGFRRITIIFFPDIKAVFDSASCAIARRGT